MSNYLVIEDDLEIAQIIINALKPEGFTGIFAQNGDQALKILETEVVDFVILDLILPGSFSGLQLYQRIRNLKPNTPIVIVSGLSSTEERLEGLRAGCDEYITKPFSPAELRIRVKNVLKFIRKEKDATTLAFGDLQLQRISRNALQNGRPLTLAKMEFLLLDLFMQNPNKVISKEQILKDVFRLHFTPPTNIVDVLVCRLRGKLENESKTTSIVTVRGIGYSLRSSVSNHHEQITLFSF